MKDYKQELLNFFNEAYKISLITDEHKKLERNIDLTAKCKYTKKNLNKEAIPETEKQKWNDLFSKTFTWLFSTTIIQTEISPATQLMLSYEKQGFTKLSIKQCENLLELISNPVLFTDPLSANTKVKLHGIVKLADMDLIVHDPNTNSVSFPHCDLKFTVEDYEEIEKSDCLICVSGYFTTAIFVEDLHMVIEIPTLTIIRS